MVYSINDSVFAQEVKNASGVVVVDFWAPWCGPCKMLGPIIDELSTEFAGKAKFTKINVDDSPVTANEFRIASIPTVMVFKNGIVVENLVGFRPKEVFKQVLQKYV